MEKKAKCFHFALRFPATYAAAPTTAMATLNPAAIMTTLMVDIVVGGFGVTPFDGSKIA